MSRYRVYGVNVDSKARLPLSLGSESGAPSVALVSADAEWFADAVRGVPLIEVAPNWYKMAHLEDGSTYVRWEDWFHFLIAPDGGRVAYALLSPAPDESLQTYLLSQTLSFALIRMGREPLHVTSVETRNAAIGFVGRSGAGKSTLAACFLAAGCRLLTDDLLVVSPETGLAQPGPQRIKVLPDVADLFLADAPTRVAMNPAGEKLIVPLGPERCCACPVPLKRLYVLHHPDDGEGDSLPRLERLSEREAFIELLAGTFNSRIRTRERLERQFACFGQLARTIPVKRLTYRRELSRISEVRDLIFADLATP